MIWCWWRTSRGYLLIKYVCKIMVSLSSVWLEKYGSNTTALRFSCRKTICFSTWSIVWSGFLNVNIYTGISLADMTQLKLHPVTHFNDDDVALFDTYFKLLCRKMSDCSSLLQADIVRSLFGTLMLELLSMMRRHTDLSSDMDHSADQTPNFHKKRIIDQFMSLLEQSDGRIRRVDVFASQLNITPRYLSAILKEVMNRRPSVYIQHFTLKAIEHRLRFTEMTMQEIAQGTYRYDASGISDEIS